MRQTNGHHHPPARAVVVTGASTGIGLAIARRLLQHGYAVFGSVRAESDAERLRSQLGGAFMPLQFDVTDADAVRRAAEHVSDYLQGDRLAGLVNNAGIAKPGPLLHLPLSELRQQFEVNVTGVVSVTQAFAPLLGATAAQNRQQGPAGRVINISSVSGRIAYPFMGAYAASKFALEAISDALRCELLIYGIDVVVIQPGAVQSEIWHKEPAYTGAIMESDYGPALARYRRFVQRNALASMPADVIASLVQHALEARRPRVRYTPVRQALTAWWLPRLLPARLLDRIMARAMHLQQTE